MIFEVWKDGKIHFRTEYESCVPTEQTQRSMKKAGYRIKIRKTGQNRTRRNAK